MYIFRVASSFIVFAILIDGFAEASVKVPSLDNLIPELQHLQSEVDSVYKNSSCNKTESIEKIIADFLSYDAGSFLTYSNSSNYNQTERGNVKNQTAKARKEENFFEKLKHKIFSVDEAAQDSENSKPRLKRCLSGISEAEVTVENSQLNFDSMKVEELQRFLKSLLECLGKPNADSDERSHEMIVEAATLRSGRLQGSVQILINDI